MGQPSSCLSDWDVASWDHLPVRAAISHQLRSVRVVSRVTQEILRRGVCLPCSLPNPLDQWGDRVPDTAGWRPSFFACWVRF